MAAGSDVLTQPQGITGTLVWAGPFDVPPLDSLTLRYEAHVSSPPGLVGNRVEATAESVLVGPAETQVTVKPWQVFLPIVSKDFKPAYFTINKTANPEIFKVGSGTNVVYTVIIRNEGDTSGTLATIYDTLPDGFVFLSMLGGSGITTNPNGTMGTITWTGPFTVSAHSQTQLIYMVSPKDVVGNYSNAVNVTAQVGTPPSGPATATVTIEPDIDYLLYDTFDTDANQWTPFTKYWRTTPEQWYWEDNVGIEGGAYNHNRDLGIIKPGGEAEDALTMYLGPGSENWTNYRFEAWIYPASIGGEDVDKAGLWFRGLFDDTGGSTQAVLAYYFYLSPGETQVNAEIWQTQTPNDCEGDTCSHPEWQYAFNNPRRLAKERWGMLTANWFNRWHKIAVEVRGNNIKGYVDDQLAVEITDTEGDILLRGSVGLACYKAPLLRYDNVLVTPLP
jgi:uncharacterized repeat protein (TIGR01451 family)